MVELVIIQKFGMDIQLVVNLVVLLNLVSGGIGCMREGGREGYLLMGEGEGVVLLNGANNFFQPLAEEYVVVLQHTR